MNELITLWKQTIGNPRDDRQFALWLAEHTPAIVKTGILKTAKRNLSMSNGMSDDHRVRYASQVMFNKAYNPQKAAGQGSNLGKGDHAIDN